MQTVLMNLTHVLHQLILLQIAEPLLITLQHVSEILQLFLSTLSLHRLDFVHSYPAVRKVMT